MKINHYNLIKGNIEVNDSALCYSPKGITTAKTFKESFIKGE